MEGIQKQEFFGLKNVTSTQRSVKAQRMVGEEGRRRMGAKLMGNGSA